MESKPLVIPEDLKKVCPLCKGKKEITYDDYEGRILGSCYFCSGTGVVWALTLEQMAERIARLEAEVKELKSAQCPYEDDAQAILDGISPEYVVQGGSVMGTLAASVVKLEAQVKTLTAQLERYEKPVSEACKKAAVEICNTYDIETPRGKTYANRPPVTISIIIEQALLASRKAAKND